MLLTNPFIAAFSSAVEFKINYAITESLSRSEIFAKIDEYAELLTEGSLEMELFLYPSVKEFAEGEKVFQVLTEAVAVMAFCPGGISIFGHQYEIINGQLKVESDDEA